METFEISKDFAFSASHKLDNLPPDHQCARLHGHNYVVRVRLTGHLLDDTGFLMDYGKLAPIKDYIDNVWDHRHLNDAIPANPTAEVMAAFLRDLIPTLVIIPERVKVSVGISETPKTWAWAR